ncbi:MAG: hypothetical protein ABS67_01885 [Niabella sp. SCN 42-15]|nr:MAG: hypothetical protein ABS67_01885 [Niabella sp. SCN 42-15]
MLQLFKIEWLKIKTYRTFWILFGTFLLFFPVSFFIIARKFMESFSAKNTSMQEAMIKGMMGNPFNFPTVWHTSAWMGGLFFIIIGMLFIMLITNEVQYRTHRQNIIDGWSRMDFLKAKASLLIFFVLCSTILVFITAIITGFIYNDGTTNIFEGAQYVLYFALMATVYLIVAYFIAIFIKRTGLAIIIYFALVCIIDNMLWAGLTFRGTQLGYFLPLESVDSLVPNPFTKKMINRRRVDDWALVVTGLGYIVLIGYTIKNKFLKTDLKT